MPFTLVHPVAVLPFYRSRSHRLRLAALVMGAIAPDFEFLLGISANGWFSHSLPGVCLVCVPAGWLCLWLFDRWGRRGVTRLLPVEWTLPTPERVGFWWITLSIVIGASTHLMWDTFTHEADWGYHLLTGLKGSFAPGWRPGMPGFKWLQDGSTLVGMVSLTWIGAAWARRQPACAWRAPLRRAALFVAVLAAAGFAAGLEKTHGQLLGGHEREVLSFGGVAVTLVFLAALVLLGIGGERRKIR